MKATLIQIGNSRGIRIPKPVIEQCGFEEQVDLQMRGHELVVRPVLPVRSGWKQAFSEMSMNNDDVMLDETPATAWELKEWEW